MQLNNHQHHESQYNYSYSLEVTTEQHQVNQIYLDDRAQVIRFIENIILESQVNRKELSITIQMRKQLHLKYKIKNSKRIGQQLESKQFQQGKDQPNHDLKFDQELYQASLLREQTLLFDTDLDIVNYIETEIILAKHSIEQLSSLCFNLFKLNKTYSHLPFQQLIDISAHRGAYTKQQLQDLESKCMENLIKIKDQRKKIEYCCVCLASLSNVVLLPCMHLILCKSCSEKVQKCPICKVQAKDKKIVYQ